MRDWFLIWASSAALSRGVFSSSFGESSSVELQTVEKPDASPPFHRLSESFGDSYQSGDNGQRSNSLFSHENGARWKELDSQVPTVGSWSSKTNYVARDLMRSGKTRVFNYNQLKNRVQTARSGETIWLSCQGRTRGVFTSNENKHLALTQNNVRLRCELNTCTDGCILRKGTRVQGRILFVSGRNFQATNISFENGNTQVYGGGAVFINADRGTTIFRDCRFKNNRANGPGGAVRSIRETSSVEFINCDFVDNRSLQQGGAVALNANPAMGRKSSSSSGLRNRAVSGGCTGIWIKAGNGERFCYNLLGNLNNRLVSSGGEDSRCVANFADLRERVSDGEVNICISSGDTLKVTSELKIDADRTRITCRSGRDCTLECQSGGYRIFDIVANDVVLDGITFKDCRVIGEKGGAIRVKGEDASIKNSRCEGNRAMAGGCIYVDALAYGFDVDATEFVGNMAEAGTGGAMYLTSSNSNIGPRNSFNGNRAIGCSDIYREFSGSC